MEATLTTTFQKPLTQGQWLRRSVGWTLACVVGWLLFVSALSNVLKLDEVSAKVVLLGSAGAAHLLIWYKAVLSTWDTVAEHTEPVWLSIVSAGWTLLLLLFQLACLALLFLALLVGSNGGILG